MEFLQRPFLLRPISPSLVLINKAYPETTLSTPQGNLQIDYGSAASARSAFPLPLTLVLSLFLTLVFTLVLSLVLTLVFALSLFLTLVLSLIHRRAGQGRE